MPGNAYPEIYPVSATYITSFFDSARERFLRLIAEEVSEQNALTDDDFVRLVESVLALVPEPTQQHRVSQRVGLPIANIVAWTNYGRRTCVSEVCEVDRHGRIEALIAACRAEFAPVELEQLSA